RLFEANLPPNIKAALEEQRIHIISLNSPSKENFGLLDSNWKNIYSPDDWISMLSASSSADIYDVRFPNLSHRFAFKDPRVISYIGNNMFDWKYVPTHGSWPGQYDFKSIAPPNYWNQQQYQQPWINIPKYQPSSLPKIDWNWRR
ncbi:MAG: hypothetical protein NTW64_02150, partial [Candidatus Omnitrophica bacterium]|nr:hypothetical protein [Candidatus Omnitrophota bacterium]